MRRLIATVYVGDVAYGPGSDLPDDVAAQITNPAAWGEDASSLMPSDGFTAGDTAGWKVDDGTPANTGAKAELESLTKADLVALAEARGVDSHGSKAELVDRLSQG